MSKITTRLSIAIAATLLSSAAMAQASDLASTVVDYGYAPGLNSKTVTVAAQPVAAKATVATAQASISNADAELGFFVPTARKQAPAATMLAGKSAQRVQ